MARTITLFGSCPSNNEAANHYVVARLHKGACTDVAEIELVSGLRSYTSTRATPVILFTPRTIAV